MNANCLAAVHNRPSVVSPHFAGALPRTGAHILSISTAIGRCCPSHCRMESVDAPIDLPRQHPVLSALSRLAIRVRYIRTSQSCGKPRPQRSISQAIPPTTI